MLKWFPHSLMNIPGSSLSAFAHFLEMPISLSWIKETMFQSVMSKEERKTSHIFLVSWRSLKLCNSLQVDNNTLKPYGRPQAYKMGNGRAESGKRERRWSQQELAQIVQGLVGSSRLWHLLSMTGKALEGSEKRRDVGYSERKLQGNKKENMERLLQKSRQEKRVV